MIKRTSTCIIFLLYLFSCTERGAAPVVSSFAGSGVMGMADGKGTHAMFANLMGIAADGKGNLYVADSHNNLIRKIDSDGNVTSFAGTGLPGSADGKRTVDTFFYTTDVEVEKI